MRLTLLQEHKKGKEIAKTQVKENIISHTYINKTHYYIIYMKI